MTTRLAPYPTLTGSEPCRKDPELFFSDNNRDRIEAQLLCTPCPVREQCLAWALDHPAMSEFGVWAGTSRSERTRLRREFRTAAKESA
ncbi:WhiB family transcriptional regulator [Streptomyces malaysiensis]|uniref:WhiB family transcriptional regulator n=1 Tax=Streptomyces malaysiensis TaxID=92644 RepID=UPI0008538E9E|nr:WhiB family transcriptional regulator [Streptomyces sp. SPMA113]